MKVVINGIVFFFCIGKFYLNFEVEGGKGRLKNTKIIMKIVEGPYRFEDLHI